MDEHPLPDPAADEALPAYEFIPVATRSIHHDGWIADRQRQFLKSLAAMGTVAYAASVRDSVTLV